MLLAELFYYADLCMYLHNKVPKRLVVCAFIVFILPAGFEPGCLSQQKATRIFLVDGYGLNIFPIR